MRRRITIIIEDDEPAGRRLGLYRRLDAAKDAAQRRYEDAVRSVEACGCNPANGGSGVCGCVNALNQVWC